MTPFLPGDSLLFALGTIAAQPTEPLNAIVLFVLLVLATSSLKNLGRQAKMAKIKTRWPKYN